MNKEKDVKHNTVYYVIWHGTEYLVMYDENRIGRDCWIRLNQRKQSEFGANGAFSQNNHFLHYLQHRVQGIKIEEASEIDALWMRKCINAGRLVECPKDVVVNNYEIY